MDGQSTLMLHRFRLAKERLVIRQAWIRGTDKLPFLIWVSLRAWLQATSSIHPKVIYYWALSSNQFQSLDCFHEFINASRSSAFPSNLFWLHCVSPILAMQYHVSRVPLHSWAATEDPLNNLFLPLKSCEYVNRNIMND